MSGERTAQVALVLAAAAVAASLGTGAAASASQGSIPIEVTSFLKDGLVAELADLYGPNAEGEGVDFTDTTTSGPTARIFVLTDGFGPESLETPVRRLNEWLTVVSIDKAVVGVATVVLPTDGGLAELWSFADDVELAADVAALAPEAALVRDDARQAWYTLAADTVSVLVPGSSGLTGSIPLEEFADATAAVEPPAPAPSGIDPGVLVGALTLGGVVLFVLIVLLLPRRKRSTADAPDAAPDADAPAAAADADAVPEDAAADAVPAGDADPAADPTDSAPPVGTRGD